MIIGNDLDALLSASLLKTLYGWDIVGIYDYTTLWCACERSDFTKELLDGKYLAVDLDIYHPAIPSVGHHVLELKDRENLPGQRFSLNPNLIRGVSQQHFRHKYPLATIHFLLWVFNIEVNDPVSQMLIWLADSAYINAQSHRFRENVYDWLSNFMRLDSLVNTFNIVDTIEYEKILNEVLIDRLKCFSLCKPAGQIQSRHQGMRGFQCQWSDPKQSCQEIQMLANFIGQITGWQALKIPDCYFKIEGIRRNLPIKAALQGYPNLAEFLKAREVFSYVFPFLKVICITNHLDLEIK